MYSPFTTEDLISNQLQRQVRQGQHGGQSSESTVSSAYQRIHPFLQDAVVRGIMKHALFKESEKTVLDTRCVIVNGRP
jgi:hypothetical protein